MKFVQMFKMIFWSDLFWCGWKVSGSLCFYPRFDIIHSLRYWHVTNLRCREMFLQNWLDLVKLFQKHTRNEGLVPKTQKYQKIPWTFKISNNLNWFVTFYDLSTASNLVFTGWGRDGIRFLGIDYGWISSVPVLWIDTSTEFIRLE